MQKTSKAGRAVKLKPEFLTDGSSKKGVMHVYDESDATSQHMQDYSDSHWSKFCCYLSVVQYRAWHDMAPVVAMAGEVAAACCVHA